MTVAAPAATVAAGSVRDAGPAPGRPEPAAGGFRGDIEGLRAVAVTLVVLGHAGVDRLAGGYVGVDVFFVVSGFLITSLLLAEFRRTGRIRLGAFYARRAVRLLPVAVLVLLATLAGSRLWLSPERSAEFAADALASALYVGNLRFAVTGTDYLAADATPSPLRHFWSLAVEEQFYLCWPVLLGLVLGLALGRPRRHGRAGALRRAALPLGTAALVAASFAVGVAETHRSAPWAYFGVHTRGWELGVGALLAIAAPRLRRSAPAGRAFPGRGLLGRAFPGRAFPGWGFLGWVGLAAVLGSAMLYDDTTAFPGVAAALPVAGAALVVAAGTTGARSGVRLLLDNRPMRTVGRLSYGWYLWHWPVLTIAPVALGLGDRTVVNLALCGAALLLAAVTYHLVENPLRHRPALRTRPARGIGLGLGLSALAAAAAVLAATFPPPVRAGAPADDLAAAVAAAGDPAGTLDRFLRLGVRATDLPANLDPALHRAAADKPRVYADGCHADTPVTRTVPECGYGDPASSRTVVLFGDSHAAHWFPALERLAVQRRWRLVSLTKNSCPAADLLVWHTGLKRAYTECQAWRPHALRRIARLRPDLVVVGTSYNYQPADGGGRPAADGAAARWQAGWYRTFDALQGTGAAVVTIHDTPYLRERAPTCLARQPRRIDRCGRATHSALRGRVQRAVVTRSAPRRGVTVVDPVAWLCTDVCPAVLGNVLVYRDANHLTVAFAAILAPLLNARLPDG